MTATDGSRSNGGPLQGVKVVEVATVVSGPYATMMLADQGAEVVKVEPPGLGDTNRVAGFASGGMTALFANCNRGKRSVVADLSTDEGRQVVLELVRRADVFVENYRPGVLERLGLGPDALRAVNPQIVSVSVTGYGPDGPYAQRRVYDPVIQGLTGHVAVQLNPEIPFPDLVRTIVCDKVTAMTVAQAVCAALFARERGAGGQHIEVPMLDASLAFFWPDGMMAHTMLAEDVLRGPTVYEMYRLTETSDGFMTYIVVTDKEWQALFDAVGRPELIDDPRFCTRELRNAHLEELAPILADAFGQSTTAEIVERLVASDVPAGPVNSLEDVLVDPQIAHSDLIYVDEHPTAGRIRQVRPAARFSGSTAGPGALAPLLGEDTDEVLAELGLS